jgi:putative ABC transport system permease protein
VKFLLSLAWKNLLRYHRRTLITATALAAGIAVFVWLDGWLVGAEKESQRNIVWYESGSAKILAKEYVAEMRTLPLKYLIEDPAAVEEALVGTGVQITRRISFAGELFFGEGSTYVKVVALDPSTDEEVFRLKRTVLSGHYLQPGQPQVLLGQWLAEDLGASPGDLLTIRTRTRYGAFQTLELQVAGILTTPNPVVNKGTAFVPLSLVDSGLEMGGAVTELALSFPEWQRPEGRLAAVRARLEAFPGLSLVTWQELAKDFLSIAQAKSTGATVLLFLVFVIAAVGISNTMLMAVYERVREIGTMRALGMRDSSIRLAFLLEAGGIGLLGSLAGLLVGAAFNYYMVRWGLDFSALIGRMDVGYRIYGVFRSAWHPQAMVSGLVFGVLASMVVSLLPSSRALKMTITEALRYE